MKDHTALVTVLLALLTVLGGAQRGTESSHRRDLVGRQFDARVVRVADGDTLEAQLSGEPRPIRIRLEGVDAPELGETFSRDAQTFLQNLLHGGTIRVIGRDLDNYGRLVARVSAAGQDASVALVRAGLACHSYARDAALAREEAQARSAGAGFWAPRATRPACVTRTAFSGREQPARPSVTPPPTTNRAPRSASRESHGFRGNESSKLYHASWCPNFNCRNCTRLFASEGEARLAGFSPAGDCKR